MVYTITNGEVHYITDMCSCCRIDTAGNHKWNCPNNSRLEKKYIIEDEDWGKKKKKEIKEWRERFNKDIEERRKRFWGNE